MISIVNVTLRGAPTTGLQNYEVRINSKTITTFEHERQPKGLAQCLRDAAVAVDKRNAEKEAAFLESLLVLMKNKSQ